MNINFDPSGQPPQTLFARIVGVVVGVIALGLALMFSAVVFVVLAVAGLALWGYFWWKTRAIRAQIEEQMRAQAQYRNAGSQTTGAASSDGDVIEGEAVRVAESERMLDRKDDPLA